jgi:hypothetical protein
MTVTKPLFIALFLLLTLVACSTSPYERGLALGEKHVEQLRAKTLTFEQFAADTADAIDEDADDREIADFHRGYREGVAPERVLLAALIAGEAAAETLRAAGTIADEVLTRTRDELEAADREAVREAGKKTGELFRAFEDSAKEFEKGVREGMKER